jgi:hypothetical protein
MSRKRRNTSSAEPEDIADDWDSSDEEGKDEAPQIDQRTGQAGAFPGLSNSSEDLFYGPAADGIDYLRMVR